MEQILFHSVEGWIAIFTAVVILIQLILAVIGMDFDTDVPDVDADFGGWDMSTLYSVKGILQFLAGSSWYLVLVQLNHPLVWHNYLIAIFVGLVADVLIALVYYGMAKLQTPERSHAKDQYVGQNAIVYSYKGDGWYVVQVSTNYGIEEVTVKANGRKEFTTGQQVFIDKYENGILYII